MAWAREQATVDARRLARRRGLWMALFGAVHTVLFSGDIIGPYGLVAVIFAGWITRKHWERALAFCAVVVVAGTTTFLNMGSFLASQGASATDAHQGVGVSTDTVLSYVSDGLLAWSGSLVSALFLSVIAPMMFLGACLTDTDLIAHPERYRRLLVAVDLGGLGLSAAGGIGFVIWVAGGPLVTWTMPLHATTGVAGTYGWLVLLALYAGGPRLDDRLTGLRRLASSVGRRSMTAYLSQTFLFAIIFTVLLALTGIELHLGEARAARIALAVWLVTVGLCAALERGSHAGPFETLLRTAVTCSERRHWLPAPPAPATPAPPVGTPSTYDLVRWDPGTQISTQDDRERFPAGRWVRTTTVFRDSVWRDSPTTASRMRHRTMSWGLWVALQNARGHLSVLQGIVDTVACLRPQLWGKRTVLMTQPPNPDQPFYQQQPSAPSAPAPRQSYPPQQRFQGAPDASVAPGVPGQPFPQPPAGGGFMGNLFDTVESFAEKFGKVFLYITAIVLVANWLYSAYNAGDIAGNYDIETQSRSFNLGKFLLSLLFDAPWVVTQIGLIHLLIELIINSDKKN